MLFSLFHSRLVNNIAKTEADTFFLKERKIIATERNETVRRALRAVNLLIVSFIFLRALKRVRNEEDGKNKELLTSCHWVAYPQIYQ